LDVFVEVGERLGGPSGLMPSSSWTSFLNASSVNVSIPQSVWWMRMISSVPEQPLADRGLAQWSG
jgi:hypothetical protein